MENNKITPEEMQIATQPTRGEKIMFTPLEAVLAKDSWDDIDVEILIANCMSLPPEVLAKLGIVKPVPLSVSEVIAQTDELKAQAPIPEEPVAEPEAVTNVTEGDETLVVEAPEATEVVSALSQSLVDNAPTEQA